MRDGLGMGVVEVQSVDKARIGQDGAGQGQNVSVVHDRAFRVPAPGTNGVEYLMCIFHIGCGQSDAEGIEHVQLDLIDHLGRNVLIPQRRPRMPPTSVKPFP